LSYEKEIFNISLIPEDPFFSRLIEYSQSIGRELPYQLGKRSLPHITLLQFYSTIGEVEEFRYKFNNTELLISTRGFQFLRFNSLDSWGLEVKRSDLMLDLQNDYLNLLKVNPINNTGQLFSPHFTLFGWESKSILIEKFKIDEKLIYQNDISTTLHFGVSSSNYQLQSILF
jgi:2'-5' RNA ligase